MNQRACFVAFILCTASIASFARAPVGSDNFTPPPANWGPGPPAVLHYGHVQQAMQCNDALRGPDRDRELTALRLRFDATSNTLFTDFDANAPLIGRSDNALICWERRARSSGSRF